MQEFDHLMYWIREREKIRIRRAKKVPPPWTENPYIANYRYCNVRRMDDKVSIWLLKWHRDRTAVKVQDRIVSCLAGRLINWPNTLSTLPYPAPFDNLLWNSVLLSMQGRGNKIFTGAYIINGALGGPKILQVTNKILHPIWEMRKTAPKNPTSMQEVWTWLNGKPGIGSFMAGQAVADLRHVHPEIAWEDVHTWAPRGPGSQRGINRLLHRPLEKPLKIEEWLKETIVFYNEARAKSPNIFSRLELMDFQNCLCEFDKFRRLTLGEGSVRSSYVAKDPT